MKDHSLKSLKLRNSLKIFIVLTLLVTASCAGEAVRVEFPLNHPANPQAPESRFNPPQNPFRSDVAVIEGEPETDTMMKHNTPKKSGKQQQQMGHKMGPKKESHSDSESKKKPAHMESGNQHQEHNQ